jgi:hypothetical protein
VIPLVYFYVVVGGLLGLIVGYMLGRLDAIYKCVSRGVDYGPAESKPTSFFAKHKESHADQVTRPGKIEIDTRTVVTEINTSGLQRASTAEMGKTTTATDAAIQQSVSKLAQLKGK